MRSLVILAFLVVACGGNASESSEPSEEALSGSSVKERWCNSYKSEEFCPKRVCVWHDGETPYCGLPVDR